MKLVETIYGTYKTFWMSCCPYCDRRHEQLVMHEYPDSMTGGKPSNAWWAMCPRTAWPIPGISFNENDLKEKS